MRASPCRLKPRAAIISRPRHRDISDYPARRAALFRSHLDALLGIVLRSAGMIAHGGDAGGILENKLVVLRVSGSVILRAIEDGLGQAVDRLPRRGCRWR